METKETSWSLSILYYLAWLICSLLIIADVLMIRQATVFSLSAINARKVLAAGTGEKTATQINAGYQVTAIDEVILFGGGVVAVSLAIAIEYYFRMGQKKGKLLRRVGTVLGIELAIILVSILVTTFV